MNATLPPLPQPAQKFPKIFEAPNNTQLCFTCALKNGWKITRITAAGPADKCSHCGKLLAP